MILKDAYLASPRVASRNFAPTRSMNRNLGDELLGFNSYAQKHIPQNTCCEHEVLEGIKKASV